MGLWHILSYPFRRQANGPLSTRQPARPSQDVPLGMEAIDMTQIDSVNRRNNALERSGAIYSSGNPSMTHSVSTKVDPLPDNETYAAAFHRAFNKKDD